MFESYWRGVKKLSPNTGALYVASKIVFGIGLGILCVPTSNKFLGIIITLFGILLMLPGEKVIIPTMRAGK